METEPRPEVQMAPWSQDSRLPVMLEKLRTGTEVGSLQRKCMLYGMSLSAAGLLEGGGKVQAWHRLAHSLLIPNHLSPKTDQSQRQPCPRWMP